MKQFIKPESKQHWLEMRSEVITSTEISALFGLNKYMSEFELWHSKKNKIITELNDNSRMFWGRSLESAIANAAAAQNNWKIRHIEEFVYDPDLKIGSSFDYEILSNSELEPNIILEIKNVSDIIYMKEWTDDEAPPHIELQVQHQMMLLGCQYAYIAALVGGCELVLIKRARSEIIIDLIKSKVAEFWYSIKNNIEPKVDFERDAQYIFSIYNKAMSDKEIYASDEVNVLVEKYKIVSSEIKKLDEKKDELKAKILMEIKDAEKCKGVNFTISAGMTSEAEYTVKRKAFRNFKITFKKDKPSE